MMIYNPSDFELIAERIQRVNFSLWLVKQRIGELEEHISYNNAYLSKNRHVISEKMEIERGEQRQRIIALNKCKCELIDLQKKQSALYAEMKKTY